MRKQSKHMPATLVIETSKIETLPFREFSTRVREMISTHQRLVTFYGSPGLKMDSVFLNAVFAGGADDQQGLSVIRCERTCIEPYHSFTADLPLFHCFEREIFEEFNLKPQGHPWLKPIRFSGKHQGKMASYPFFKLEGKENHEVGVGPIHAGVIEPGHFRFSCYGEMVHHLEIQLGYQHRGVEKLLLQGRPDKLAPLIETIVGDSTVAHTWAYCHAWERLCGYYAEDRIELVRAIALELERVAMHLGGLAGMATDIGFLPGGSTYGRLRTAAINSSMRLCGSRFSRGWLRPGELRFGIDASIGREVIGVLKEVQHDIAIINGHFLHSETVKHRLKNTGTLTSELVKEMGFVGLVARTCGLEYDVRTELPGALYRSHPILAITEPSGDCWARARIRIREIDESLQWIIKTLTNHPEFKPCQAHLGVTARNTVAISLIEGWRGEVVHVVETDDHGQIRFYRAQDPSLRNWFALAMAVRQNEISDFPICNKSFDLSYCGNDL
ncbi:hydrogenase [Bdellovibrionota bacterium FG-1]